jgi:tetratricopeptide (TPR) repeat protein
MIAKRSGSGKHLAKAHTLLGILAYKKGDYSGSLRFHAKALDSRIKMNDRPGQAISHTNLGNVYSDLKAFEKARLHYLDALNLYAETNDEKGKAKCLVNLGVLEQTTGQKVQAVEDYSLALVIADRLHDYETRSLCLNNIAQIYFEKGDYERSISLNYDALKLRELMENEADQADSYLNLASNYLKLSRQADVIANLNKAKEVADRYGYFEAQQMARKLYSEYFHLTGDHKTAYEYLLLYQQKNDSVMSAAANIMSELPVISQTQDKSAGTKNQWLLASIFIFLIFVPFGLVRYKR